jgi:hypothetical protein
MTLVDFLGDAAKPSVVLVAEKGFRRESDSDEVLERVDASGTITGNGDDTERDLEQRETIKLAKWNGKHPYDSFFLSDPLQNNSPTSQSH